MHSRTLKEQVKIYYKSATSCDKKENLAVFFPPLEDSHLQSQIPSSRQSFDHGHITPPSLHLFLVLCHLWNLESG
jgi:hypothetical protein